MPEIGATLRDARMRAHIDVSEIEAQTKIRAKYLRALENEEWDLLPGPTYVKSFLRTYAQALGLDSKVLLEEYRASHERLSENDLQPIVPPARRHRNRERQMPSRLSSGGFIAAVVVLLLVIGLIILGLAAGGGGGNTPVNTTAAHTPAVATHHHHHHTTRAAPPARPDIVSLRLRPTAEVWVCLVARGNRHLINGVILTPANAPTTTYRSSHFLLTLGNSSVTLEVNGQPETVPPSSQPTSYSITATGREQITSGQLPVCA